MKPTHIDHIGIAVKNLEEAITVYERLLGRSCYAIEEVPDQKVRTAFFNMAETKIELLASTAADGPIAKFIEKRGEGIHHIAYAVEGLPSVLRELESEGIELIDREPRPGAEGMRIAFLHPRASCGVLTELCEKG
jgi:methylmalonyl-CoA/ethylmalonyl-CoA epimerase